MREELELFAYNLNVFMNKYGYNQTTLANKLEVGVTTVAYTDESSQESTR